MLLEYFGDFTAAQTALAIVAAPGASNKIRVWSILASSAGTNITHILTGAGGAVRCELHTNATSTTAQYVAPAWSQNGLFDIPIGVELDLTTTLTGAHSVSVLYEILPA